MGKLSEAEIKSHKEVTLKSADQPPITNDMPKNWRFVLPLIATWVGITLLLFYNLLSGQTLTSDSHFWNFMLGCCLSFCYFWGIYHWVIVAQQLLNPKAMVITEPWPVMNWPRIAILYCICDNLDRNAIMSAKEQDYPGFDVYILDDSRTLESQKEVDRLACDCGFSVFRRIDRSGYKAGNLNYALARLYDQYRFVAINDADELLIPSFLRFSISLLLANPDLAFVQANHSNRTTPADTYFAKRFGLMTDVRWEFYRQYSNRSGSCFSLGHGLILRTSSWLAAGGYPTVVSEDIAMTLRLLASGRRGMFLYSLKCYERFSDSYNSFRRRFARCVEADIECIRTEMLNFLFSPHPQFVEKIDALIRECRYPSRSLFFPLAIALSFIVACGNMPGFLSHPCWVAFHVCLLLSPWIPYVISLNLRQSLSFFGSSVWAFSSLAIVMFSAGVCVFFRKPSFNITFQRRSLTKNESHTIVYAEMLCGMVTIACALLLSSASLFLIGSSLITLPLLNKDSWWQSDFFSFYLPIIMLACCVYLSGIPNAAIVMLPLVLLLY